jgi:AraC-like DNA-binding protein
MEKIEIPLMTIGRTINPGMQVLIWHNPEETFNPVLGFGKRFCLVLVERGSGIVSYGGRKHVFSSPALFCFAEDDKPQINKSEGVKAQAFYFHPAAINKDFDFCNVRELDQPIGMHDQMWVRPFFIRDEHWAGVVKLGPAAFARISRLFSATSRELSLQRDGFWPCRSRSFFLEILFLLERLYTLADVAETELLTNDISLTEVEPVLLYLHNNYNQKICLDGLARAFNTNRTTLTKQFHESTGMPVMTYLNRLRINLAALMLRDTSLSINEIVERVGLTNPTHFGRAFRKATGYTPSEYRRQYCWLLQ